MTEAKQSSAEARLDALEVRVAYQDETMEALNKTITAQWQKIDALVRDLARLRDRIEEAETNAGQTPSDQPPPHY